MIRILPLFLLGCVPARGVLRIHDAPGETGDPTTLGSVDPDDQDGDGFSPADGDCDDLDPKVNPKAPEVLGDGIDNDCRGQVYAAPTAY